MSRYLFSHDDNVREFIETKFSGCFDKTPYAKKIIDISLQTFPKRLSESEISKEINISVRWLQRECKKAFNITYVQLARVLKIYYAVKYLYETSLANKEIALELEYSEESSMARDFRKVLGLSPDETRLKLSTISIFQLFGIM